MQLNGGMAIRTDDTNFVATAMICNFVACKNGVMEKALDY